MQADFQWVDGVIVVYFKGHLSYESACVFRTHCLTKLRSEKVVFDFRKLSFVGSNGIKSFVETMVELSVDKASSIKFCGVGNEFYRVFQASPLRDVEIYEDDKKACVSFNSVSLPTVPVTGSYIEASEISQDFSGEEQMTETLKTREEL